LFPIFGVLDSQFHETKIIVVDIVALRLRSPYSLISKYFTDDDPIVIETNELFTIFDHWFELSKDGNQAKFQN